jgi:hypothetical protein|tara:strand:- start:14908 stop:15381 length:474 start_codon:yes stop_codon:yes gene_type:complete
MEKKKAKPETHIGRIARTSPYGFQLEQHVADEKWINYGNYFEGKKEWEVGQEVECAVNALGDKMYLNQIDLSIDAKDKQIDSAMGVKDDFDLDEFKDNTKRPSPNQSENQKRQRSIVRQSSLKSAVEFAKGQDLKLEEVFNIAEAMYDWVEQDEVPF